MIGQESKKLEDAMRIELILGEALSELEGQGISGSIIFEHGIAALLDFAFCRTRNLPAICTLLHTSVLREFKKRTPGQFWPSDPQVGRLLH